jgi:hypothetical protein
MTYEDLLEAYEQRGEIPTAAIEDHGLMFVTTHECPWCKNWFVVNGVDHIHCPYCCMEMYLDWGDE